MEDVVPASDMVVRTGGSCSSDGEGYSKDGDVVQTTSKLFQHRIWWNAVVGTNLPILEKYTYNF